MKERFPEGPSVRAAARIVARKLAVGIVLVVCLTREASAQEPWHVAYENGVNAVRQGHWARAEEKLKAARRDGPAEGRNVRAYGVRFIDFIPSFHLGVVYFNQQRYQAALDELERAASLGLVTERNPEHAQMTELTARARALLEPERPASSPAGVETPRAVTVTGEEQEAAALIEHARMLLEQEDLEGAQKALESARAKDPGNVSLQALEERISEREAGRLARAEKAALEKERTSRVEIQTLLATGERLLQEGNFEEVRRLTERARIEGFTDARFDELAERAEFGREMAELSKLVTAKKWSLADQKASQLARGDRRNPELLRLQARIDKGLAEDQRGDLVESGLRAFYSGSYQRAIEILEPLAASDSRSALVLFHLACSRAALAMWGTEEERRTLLSQARAEFTESKRLDPHFQFDSRWISPRILSLLTESSR